MFLVFSFSFASSVCLRGASIGRQKGREGATGDEAACGAVAEGQGKWEGGIGWKGEPIYSGGRSA